MELSQSSPDQQSKQQKLLERLMAATFLLTAMYLVSHNVADPDLWGHVQYGQDVIRDGIVHPTTTYSFTADGYRWINHENLSELLMASVVNVFGIWGLLAWKALVAAFVFGTIFWLALKRGLSLCWSGMFVMLVASNLAFHWSFRPQILSFFFFSLMLLVLHVSFDGWTRYYLKRPEELDSEGKENQHKFNTRRVRLLWIMPLILFLWANSHGGFVAGVCIYLAFLFGRTIEAFYYRGWRASGMARRLTLMGVCGVLATLINPYGLDLHLWLLSSLGEPRPEIMDWHGLELTSANGARLIIAAVIAIASIAYTKQKRDWTQIAIIGLVLWQSIEHVRHVAFFALIFGFWVPVHLASSIERAKAFFTRREKKDSAATTKLMTFVNATAVALLLVLSCWRMTDIRVEKEKFPVEAFQYMTDHQLSGRMVVNYNWAQYVIGAFGGQHKDLPHCPVAFDGRFRTCYPQEIVDMHFDFLMGDQGPGMRHRSQNSPPIDETAVLRHRKPELVLISRRHKPPVQVMEQSEDWVKLYQDSIAQLWGVKSRFGDPASPYFLPEDKRVIGDRPQVGAVTWPALPKSRRGTTNRKQFAQLTD